MDTLKLKEKADKLGVSTDVYIFLRKSNRKIRYFTSDLKEERIEIESESITFIPSREVSFDELCEDDEQFATEGNSVEGMVVDNDLLLRLRQAIESLDDGERRLIQEIFFSRGGEGKTEYEASQSIGIARMTLHDQKVKTLAKLKKLLN